MVRRLLTHGVLWVARFSGRVAIVCKYIAVGSMSLADVKDGVRRSWEGFYCRDEDVALGLMDWERDLVDRFVRPGHAVLVVGSGSGRDVIPLARRGCRITGVEPAAAPLAVAGRALASRGLSATLVGGFFEDVELTERFDVVIFSFYAYSYIPEARRRVEALRKACAHLADNGRIIVSYPPMRGPRPILISLARAAGTLFRSDWRLEPGDHVSVEGGEFLGFGHAFEGNEIAREATAAGLTVLFRSDYPDPVAVFTRTLG
jgi:SAM-dependent methyltransferase